MRQLQTLSIFKVVHRTPRRALACGLTCKLVHAAHAVVTRAMPTWGGAVSVSDWPLSTDHCVGRAADRFLL